MIEDRSCCEKERDTVERWKEKNTCDGRTAKKSERGEKERERGRERKTALGRKQYSIY